MVRGTIGRRLSAAESRVTGSKRQLRPPSFVSPLRTSQCRFPSAELTSGAPVEASAFVETKTRLGSPGTSAMPPV